MLVLSRKSREAVVIGEPGSFEPVVKVTVLELNGGNVGLGFEADSVFRLPASEGGVISTTLDLPPELVALRFDPLEGRGTFQLGRLTLTEILVAVAVTFTRRVPAAS